MSVFGSKASKTQTKCNWFHRFKAFQAVFLADNLLLPSASMPNINKIDCKTKRSIEAHGFAPLISTKSLTVGNIAVFEDFNVNQIRIKKIDTRWNDWLTIW